jgi:hypothetical protein
MVLHSESCAPCQQGALKLAVGELAALGDELPG